jgi:hypothetical protein
MGFWDIWDLFNPPVRVSVGVRDRIITIVRKRLITWIRANPEKARAAIPGFENAPSPEAAIHHFRNIFYTEQFCNESAIINSYVANRDALSKHRLRVLMGSSEVPLMKLTSRFHIVSFLRLFDPNGVWRRGFSIEYLAQCQSSMLACVQAVYNLTDEESAPWGGVLKRTFSYGVGTECWFQLSNDMGAILGEDAKQIFVDYESLIDISDNATATLLQAMGRNEWLRYLESEFRKY